ncbi:rhamnan synthesis F family protein [Amnibacterium flavum]|uniref:Uncharacterized protein n=1 Tax=Amnibacterium flavum TaxID=2173173 RepID=A0A2V1HTD8_9MICO|nr:rhamnan synthesis F family protein [Amnibacterium flavum]PVZ95866.1 hypothetical protein DDQ50_05220 [Amnibacterium flavum]
MTAGLESRRLVVYAIDPIRTHLDEHVVNALRHLEALGSVLVSAPRSLPVADRDRLDSLVDHVTESPSSVFASETYGQIISDSGLEVSRYKEVVLTGDGWFGPVADFGPTVERMASSGADVWQLAENLHDNPEEDFPDEGFASRSRPWIWTSVSPSLLNSPIWRAAWSEAGDDDEAFEQRFGRALAARGARLAYAFRASAFASGDPLLYDAVRMIEAGCPVVGRRQFEMFPAFLDQRAIVGRDTLDAVAATGYPVDLILGALVRSVPPRALATNLGMLEVLPDKTSADEGAIAALRVLAVVHVSDVVASADVFERLGNLPPGYDLLVTVSDGMTAARLQQDIEMSGDIGFARLELRVVPPSPGRDMSDFFVGCRDVLLEGGYDIVVKVHSRRISRKTMNVRRYFRRYQVENLLNSPEYVRNLLTLFLREPGLGLVFPPMMHIGYGTMGNGWAGLSGAVDRLLRELKVTTPTDSGSPLAPYGGMWVARPEALRRMLSRRWKHSDYFAASRALELAHAQERTIVLAAAEDGFHARTVLTAEHASISHTALEYKVDALSPQLRGYPLDQIRFLRRMGSMSFGGPIAVARMWLTFRYPRVSRLLSPIYTLARRAYQLARFARRAVRIVLKRLADSEMEVR